MNASELRVLIVGGSRVERDLLLGQLAPRVAKCTAAATGGRAREMLAAEETPNDGRLIVVVHSDLADGPGLGFVESLSRERRPIAAVMISRRGDVDEAVAAMQAGAADLVPPGLGGEAMTRRLEDAAERVRRDDLAALCRRVGAQRPGSNMVAVRDDEMGDTSEVNGMQKATVAEEFSSLVRQELDIESLLRSVLEFVLDKIGATNAAVFLPTSSGEYNLGAYVNYTCPKDTAEVLLENLAATAAPALEDERRVLRISTEAQLHRVLGDGAEWIEGSEAIAFSCRHEDECLAAVVLFRDESQPFGAGAEALCEMIRTTLADQLARVIRVHHRCGTKSWWDSLSDNDDAWGMAA